MHKVVVLTSNKKRHNFFVNTLAQVFDLVGVLQEEKRAQPKGDTELEDAIISQHFRELSEAEERYFSEHETLTIANERLLKIERGFVNSPKVFEWISAVQPDYLVLFGTAIIKDPVLSTYSGRIINIHLGLSPYYRGSGTNFWPLVDGLPECVGATIHLATPAVDGGPVISQVRPDVAITDRNHDLGCKTIIVGAERMARCIEAYATNRVIPKMQRTNIGRVFKKKDFNAEAVLQMKKNFENGMIKAYVEHKHERDAAYPIIE